jgi:hypothetical protein
MKQQYLGDNEVEARPVEIEPTEIAAANLDHLTGERLDPVRLEVHDDITIRQRRHGPLATA